MSINLQDLPPQSHTASLAYRSKLTALKARQEKDLLDQKKANHACALERTLSHFTAYRTSDLNHQTSLKESELTNRIYIPRESHFFVVVLIKSKIRMSAKLKTVTELLRLKKINTMVFVKNNESNRNLLKKIRNYVTYGFVGVEVLREILYKRGIGRCYDYESGYDYLKERDTDSFDRRAKGGLNNCSLVNLTNESIIKAFNGELRCLEDIVFHLYYGTECFKVVNNFLNPIGLNCPTKGFKNKKKDFVMEGDAGMRGFGMEELIKRMID